MDSLIEITLNFYNSILTILYSKWHIFLISIPATFILFFVEIFFLGWNNSSLKRLTVNPSNSALTDSVSCFLSLTGLGRYISIVLSFGAASTINSIMNNHFGFGFLNKIENQLISFVVILIVSDFIAYWKHRLNHEIGFLWELHKFHHSASEMNLITTHRLHPFNEAVSEILFSLPVALLGVTLESYIAFRIINNLHQCIKHSYLPFTWGQVGVYLLISPVTHLMHHSIKPNYSNKNYGFIFTWWDHIFGTWEKPIKTSFRIGLIDEDFKYDPWYKIMWSCYISFLEVLFLKIKTMGLTVIKSKFV